MAGPADEDHATLDILLVDDDADVAEMYRLGLGARGHRVEVAHDGPSGLRRAEARPPDLLLLDLRLPGFDGIELLSRLRREPATARLPVLVLTNYGGPALAGRCAAMGVMGHAIKAHTAPAELATRLGELGIPRGLAAAAHGHAGW